MKKKIIISAITVALVLSLTACGRPENAENSLDDGTASNEMVKVEGYNRIKPDVSKTGENDSLGELDGCFIEYTDNEETGYISINEEGALYVKKDEIGTYPLGIEASEEGLLIYYGSKTPADDFCEYSFDGTTLKLGDNVEWKKVDYFALEGTYQYDKEDQSGFQQWTFNSDGTVHIFELSDGVTKENDIRFTQDKDNIFLIDAKDYKMETSYTYDKETLVLTTDTTVMKMNRIL